MKTQNVVIITYICLLIIALILDEPVSAGFIIVVGLLTLAMLHYGGERLRKILRRLLLS